MPSEAQLIDRFFRAAGAQRDDVVLGIGDDAALLRVPPQLELAVTTDALVEGVHFLPGADPEGLGHRALAVNLSDLAAMGAEPRWMLLSLVLPGADESWLRAFSNGLKALAIDHKVALVGGNLSRGPLSITLQLAGCVPPGEALRRSGARPGDDLYVSGTTGDAAAGRELLHGAGTLQAQGATRETLERRFTHPQPRVALGQALRGVASACIDVSDGLYEDAERLLTASGCAATIEAAALPLSAALCRVSGVRAARYALYGGEDYELCFTADPTHAAAIAAIATRLALPLTRIGKVLAGSALKVKFDGPPGAIAGESGGPEATFDHFRH